MRCTACGVIFSDIAAVTYAAQAHNSWHEPDVDSGTRAFYGAARRRAHMRFLELFPPSASGRLLDIGCGLGYFMASAAAAGWDAYGCDTSERWARRAATETGTPDHVACCEPVPGLFGGSFAMITVWDVLEHIHDPLPFLRAAAQLLAPHGRLFIRTPNIAWVYPTYALRRHLLGSDVVLGPLNHVVYYSARTLRLALGEAGLTPVRWPVLPPPQVGLGNRGPERAGSATPTTLLKNAHAGGADRLARLSRGRLVLGADLDVLAEAG